jgi:hypothetical protein
VKADLRSGGGGRGQRRVSIGDQTIMGKGVPGERVSRVAGKRGGTKRCGWMGSKGRGRGGE